MYPVPENKINALQKNVFQIKKINEEEASFCDNLMFGSLLQQTNRAATDPFDSDPLPPCARISFSYSRCFSCARLCRVSTKERRSRRGPCSGWWGFACTACTTSPVSLTSIKNPVSFGSTNERELKVKTVFNQSTSPHNSPIVVVCVRRESDLR